MMEVSARRAMGSPCSEAFLVYSSRAAGLSPRGLSTYAKAILPSRCGWPTSLEAGNPNGPRLRLPHG